MLNSRTSPGAQTAAQTDLDALAVTVGLKANQSDVASLSTALGTKASQTDHDLLDTAFATQSSLLSLTTLLLGAKASQTDLTNLTTSVANHVSLIANPFSSNPPPCFYRVWYKRFASAMPPNNHAQSELASAERTGSISGTASTAAVHDTSFGFSLPFALTPAAVSVATSVDQGDTVVSFTEQFTSTVGAPTNIPGYNAMNGVACFEGEIDLAHSQWPTAVRNGSAYMLAFRVKFDEAGHLNVNGERVFTIGDASGISAGARQFYVVSHTPKVQFRGIFSNNQVGTEGGNANNDQTWKMEMKVVVVSVLA